MTGARTRACRPTVVGLAIASAVVVGGIGVVRAAGQAPLPTGQTPAFRGGVTLVELSALVTDDRQQPLTDLTADDFEILEDGERRPLVSVRYLSTRTTAPATTPVALPGRAEQIVGNDTADAPAFVLLLDDLNVSPYDAHRAIRAGLGVVDAVPGSALLSVLTTSGDGNGLLTLTPPNDDHAALVRAFRGRFMLSGPPPNPYAPQTTSSSVDAPCGVGSAAETSPDCVDPTRAARRAAAVEAVGRLLSRAGSRRKVLFWLTTDMGVSPLDPRGNRAAQMAALLGVLGGDVTVYPVDPRENYYTRTGDNDRRTGGRIRVGTSDTVFQGAGGSTMSLDTDDMVGVPLSQIARDTGGRWIQWTNNLEKTLAAVVTQNSSAYILAFEPANAATPGPHRIEVKVRRKGARVSARRAYVRPADEPAPDATGDATTALLRRVLQGAVSQGTLGLRLHVAPQFASAGTGRALVTLAVDAATIGEQSAAIVHLVTVDERGSVANERRLTLSKPHDAAAMEGSLTLTITQGRHELRVAAVTPDGTRSGLVLHPIEVAAPGDHLSLGIPVLLGEDASGVHPTLSRDVPVGHPLAVQLEVASRDARRLAAVVRARLLDAGGVAVRDVQSSGEPEQSSSTRLATLVVATDGLPPGAYRLVVDAPDAKARPADGHVLPIRLLRPEEGQPDESASRAAPRALDALPVAHGPLIRHSTAGPLVIRTAAAWTMFWKALPTRQPPPDIDFDRVTLLAIVSDAGAAAFTPLVESVHTEPGGIVVRWRRTTPPRVADADDAVRPFVIVGLTDVHGNVRFEDVPSDVR